MGIPSWVALKHPCFAPKYPSTALSCPFTHKYDNLQPRINLEWFRPKMPYNAMFDLPTSNPTTRFQKKMLSLYPHIFYLDSKGGNLHLI